MLHGRRMVLKLGLDGGLLKRWQRRMLWMIVGLVVEVAAVVIVVQISALRRVGRGGRVVVGWRLFFILVAKVAVGGV